MGFKCGIVGLPNVGKSTLYNAITKAGIEAENYPFCTIEPNIGVVAVPDPRLDNIAKIAQSKKVIPTTVNFVDIAGLVAGASQGEGLGNKFLSHIRETQSIAHVIRCFDNPDVTHVSGKIDPVADIEVINTELALSDLETVQKSLLKAVKNSKSGDKKALFEKACLEKIKTHLDAGHSVRTLSLEDNERDAVKGLHLLTYKPILYVANVDETGLNGNDYVEQVKARAAEENAIVVTICAGIEAEIAELSDDDKLAFLKDYGLKEPGLNRFIHAGYSLLGLQTYFTAGPKEARAWTVKIGATAPEAAGVIHTDFEKGFIRAEVIAYDDYIQYQGEHGAREAGKLRSEGKDYIVQDGDIILFRFNV